ncbi:MULTISPECIES: AtuA-related protein [Robiginitalea]|uniref:AtuA-related protein n=1 Tax=Robiginitalea TaxID=252306 RepID=UPI002349C88B|nr:MULTISPECIES: hypothetical protein [unclassified Robiginitalea]MDC6354797.1 hypothetical protein [Robiginitalea sp. PM2]MDC6375063.1 hypothetical protein [Robiginitalea sp. SP8]
MKLHELAHSRTGDKGNISNISVVAYRLENYDLLRERLTADRVAAHFASRGVTRVLRYELPQLGALNFVLYDALSGGVTSATTLDKHGKTLSSYLLQMEI